MKIICRGFLHHRQVFVYNLYFHLSSFEWSNKYLHFSLFLAPRPSLSLSAFAFYCDSSEQSVDKDEANYHQLTTTGAVFAKQNKTHHSSCHHFLQG